MTVGVVIPNRDMGSYLRQAVESVLRQTVWAHQIVIVDGCSTDDSEQVTVDLMRDSPMIEAYTAPPLGMAHARNLGIVHLYTDLIIPLDADDWLEPNYIERCLAEMGDGIGIVAPGLRWADTGRAQYPKEPVTVGRMLRENCVFGCSMFRRECWEQAGGYDEQPRHYEDWSFFGRILAAGWGVSIIREPLYNYRAHPASSSARMKSVDDEEYRRSTIEKIRSHLRRFGAIYP